MNIPLILFEHGTLQAVFKSQHDAEITVEWIDVENEEYEIFDSQGYLLKQTVVDKSRRGRFAKRITYKGVDISHFDPPVYKPDELRQLLIGFLARHAEDFEIDPQTTSLEMLVDKVTSLWGYD